MWKNTTQHYGFLSQLLHWISAFIILALFALGYWMVDLTYYSEWYQTAPHWHESVGILLLITTLFRLFWRYINTTPNAISTHSTTVKISAALAHILLYILLLILMFSGYLIPTADDRAIEVFSWFTVPSLGELFINQADLSGIVHQYGAYLLIALAILHAIAAVKHHFIDKDETLLRMLFQFKNTK